MAAERLGVAVVGAGMAGRAHAAGYRSATTTYGGGLPEIQLVAIADLNKDFAQDTARRFGYERAEADWQALAEAEDVDVVSVVTANHLHREMVVGLLEAGKHVLCEKPFAPTVEDAQVMVDAAAAHHEQVTGIGFSFRRSPAISAVREQVRRGSIGTPVHFNGHYWCDYASNPDAPMSWRYKGGPGSGALADIGSHLVDAAEYLCGPIASVRGALLHTSVTERRLPAGNVVGHAPAELSDAAEAVENEDVVTFTVRFTSGAMGTLSASRSAVGLPNSLGFELFGERGAAWFDNARPAEFRFVESGAASATSGVRQVLAGPAHPYLNGGLAMDFPGVGYGQNDLFVFQARAFLEQVAGVTGLEPVPGFAHGLRNLLLLEAVVESAANGGAEMTVPPSDETESPA